MGISKGALEILRTVVVPQAAGDEVARRARLIQDKDRPGRREHYEALGIPLDETVT